MVTDGPVEVAAPPAGGYTNMNKPELLKKCAELGIVATANDTKAKLALRIRQELGARTMPRGGELMQFGKHADKVYLTVKASDPTYCQWCEDTVDENSDWRMKRFVQWLKHERENPTPTASAGPMSAFTSKELEHYERLSSKSMLR